MHVRDQRAVELDDVGAHAHHLAQAGVALAGVVDGDAGAAGAQRVEQALEPLDVEHALLLGDLEHEAAHVGGELRDDLLPTRAPTGSG